MSLGAESRFTSRHGQRESRRYLRAPARPAAGPENENLKSRRQFEYRLGQFLATHPRALGISGQMCGACLQFLSARAAALRHSREGRAREFYASLRRVLRPVALPFAGRVRNVRELLDVLNGRGSIRELQGTVWLVFSHVLTEDAVGPCALSALPDILSRAGMNPAALRRWVATAVEHRRRTHVGANAAELNPHEELFRMPWHAARQGQTQTRIYFSDFHLKWRYWSLITRREFENEGGVFSRIERHLESALGPHTCPWLDVRRFTSPNESSALVQFARRGDVPLETGVSGVAVQSIQFARVLGMSDFEAVRIAVAGYLMSIKAHSFYEIIYSMQNDETLPIIPLDYQASLNVDWREVTRACGPVPRNT